MVNMNEALRAAVAEIQRALAAPGFLAALARLSPMSMHKGKRRRTRWWVR
jgi:hypothetical protein